MTSSAKKRREPGSTRISQTPDGSFFDLQRNAWHLLHACGVSAPEVGDVESYLARGPGFICLFHPALGAVICCMRSCVHIVHKPRLDPKRFHAVGLAYARVAGMSLLARCRTTAPPLVA